MKSGGAVESLTGNLVFLILVTILGAAVMLPIVRGDLSPEALTNIAIGAMGSLATMAAMAAGWHWRGKVQASAEGTGSGTTTTTTDAVPGTSSVVTVKTTADATGGKQGAGGVA